jgi:hypothetical protein
VINEQERRGLFDRRGWKNLQAFVERGGSVWVETGGNSIYKSKGSLPELLPGHRTNFDDLGQTWELGGELKSQMAAFELSPLKYDADSWSLSYMDEKQLREGSRILVSQAGKPIVVERELGKGKVLWSGVNWFYRYDKFRDNWLKEVRPIGLFMERLFGRWGEQAIEAKVELVAPGESRLTVNGAKGVVYKVNKYPGWTAYAQSRGKKERLEIYAAGPELMYVGVPEEMQADQVEVVFKYNGAPTDWLALGITIVGLVVVGVFLISGRVMLPSRLKKWFKVKGSRRRKRSIRQWWNDEG